MSVELASAGGRPKEGPEAGSTPGRLTVALPFKYQEKWIGGLYFARNLVAALGLLPRDVQPLIIALGTDAGGLDYLRRETGYEHLSGEPGENATDSASRRLLRALHLAPAITDRRFDVVLMGSLPGLEDRSVQWIPDFQEERFPEFFRPGEIHARRRLNSRALARHRHVMVSSDDVRSDLELYYGKNANRVHVLKFASFADLEIGNAAPAADLIARYDLPPRFFICNNQLWRHKNHGVILRALAETRGLADPPTVVFTGLEHDYRHRDHAPSIKSLAKELGLAERARFLGFLPRADQLGLMASATAVVQPSLCEGWSVVVEDAKALGKHVLASDIAVHREQLGVNADFFAPDDIGALAELLSGYRRTDPTTQPTDYGRTRREFAHKLLTMLREVAGDARPHPA